MAYLGVSFFLYPIWLLLIGAVRRYEPPMRRDLTPTAALIVAAYNEERVIGEKLVNALELDYPRERLRIVVLSESRDGTNAIVSSFADRGVELVEFATRTGKSAMQARVVPSLLDEVLVFTDADTFIARDALRALVAPLSDPQVGVSVGELTLVPQTRSGGSLTEASYWRVESRLKRIASRSLSVLGANGALYAVRREAYLPLSEARADDFEIAVQARIHGYGVCFVPSARCWETARQTSARQFRRKLRLVRWFAQSAFLLMLRAVAAGRIEVAAQLLVHKFARWLAPPVLVAVGSAVIAPDAVTALVLLAAVSVAMVALFRWESLGGPMPRALAPILYAAGLVAASTLGLALALVPRGRDLWDPSHQD